MKGSEAKLVSYMQGSDKRFIIPVYQRNYDWRTENCKQLYEDLKKIIEKKRNSHFFGSIVSVHNDGEFNEYLIIDGQQRLTTVSLLMLAIYNLITTGAVTPVQANLADMIYETYLIDKWKDDETRIKLKPVKNDSKAYGMLFKKEKDYVQESNLTANYNYFCSLILKKEISVDDLYKAITKLEIINITLNNEDNPQLIFESLNSTGLALSEGDKIRNFILMGLPPKQQTEYYEDYWNKIEINTHYDVSSFIRDYLTIKQQTIPAISKVYITFKSYVSDGDLKTQPLLEDLLAYSERYSILLNANSQDKRLKACIYRLNRLETTVTRPFFMEVLRLHEQEPGILSLQNVVDIFLYTETYLFRRSICSVPTNALNKIFMILNREIYRYEGNYENYLEKFKYAILSKTDQSRFPRDDEFIESFSTRPIYQMNAKSKIYLLERFENHDTIEDKEIYKHCDDGDYSVEHIMPQHLNQTWEKDLGPDYEMIHETWVDRVANLTLTGYNSKYSNNAFTEKRDMKHGFRESGLRLNQWISQQEKWTLEQLEERNNMLIQQALTIWTLPDTTYQPAEKPMDFYTLEDDVDLSGRELGKYSYRNFVQPVTSWIEMLQQIVKILHAEDKTILSKLAHSHDSVNELSTFVTDNADHYRGTVEIEPGIYLIRNTSTTTKVNMLRKLFKAFDANPEDLIFYLRDSGSGKVESPSEVLRRQYWASALDMIHETHGNNGAFKNINPTHDSWVKGGIGIGGFSITMSISHGKADVSVEMSRSDRKYNKAAFDYLYLMKDSIEADLGVECKWWRLDDKIASFVSYHLKNVDYNNENDWPQMAQFHTEWSQKFYDEFVPLLKKWTIEQ